MKKQSMNALLQGLRILQILTSIAAIVALILAIIALNHAAAGRRESARDSCQLMLGLVRTATPPKEQTAAAAYIARTPLHSCNAYARAIVK